MIEDFKIHLPALREQEVKKIYFTASSGFLELQESELSFPFSVEIEGQTYITDQHLILRLKAKTKIGLPCAICNETVLISLEIKDFYHAELLEEVSGSDFDFAPTLREAILLEVPPKAECDGRCSKREELTPYLKQPIDAKADIHFPFADLDHL